MYVEVAVLSDRTNCWLTPRYGDDLPVWPVWGSPFLRPVQLRARLHNDLVYEQVREEDTAQTRSSSFSLFLYGIRMASMPKKYLYIYSINPLCKSNK